VPDLVWGAESSSSFSSSSAQAHPSARPDRRKVLLLAAVVEGVVVLLQAAVVEGWWPYCWRLPLGPTPLPARECAQIHLGYCQPLASHLLLYTHKQPILAQGKNSEFVSFHLLPSRCSFAG
jgi:hypothetical protein